MKKNSLTRVRHVGVKTQVFAQLRDRIMDGTWPPGGKIPSETALAEALGVSRVSIREALHMLASLGLLESKQGGGTFVREYTGEIFLNPLLPNLALAKLDILQVLEYRKIAEKGNVSLAVKRAGEAEIEELEASLRTMQERKNDPRAFAEADLSFHLLVAKATGNPFVMKVNAIIADILKISMYGIVESLGPKDGLYYHRKILDAIIDRDVTLAENLMEEHIERTIRRLKRKHGEDRVFKPLGWRQGPMSSNGFEASLRTSGPAP
jgi:GntR family transcriptional regulator, transcriptional repressor for pyruvate dehydrogenase complex